MNDGSVFFAGSSRGAIDHNYQYNAFFLHRVNVINGEKSCINMKNIPDPTAVTEVD